MGFKYLITTSMDGKGTIFHPYHAGFNSLNAALSYASKMSEQPYMSPVSVYKHRWYWTRNVVAMFKDGEQIVWSGYRS